jgi:NADPH:quinone reductase-like Zn-dependent oxidoreductase
VECVAISARNVVPLPDSIPYVEAASIGYGLTTAVYAAMAEPEVGEWVVVYGVGA